MIVTAHPGLDVRGGAGEGAARGGLPWGHARHRGAEPGAPVTAGAAVRVGVVGLGYWGPNLARNFDRLAGVRAGLDLRRLGRTRLARLAPALPGGPARPPTCRSSWTTPSWTPWWWPRPVPTHAELAERVLAAGKHCFVEKPLAQSAADAERVVAAAARGGPGADGRPPARVPPRAWRSWRPGRRGRARRHPLHLRQPPEPGEAARRGERALEPGRARRVGGAAPGGRGARRSARPSGESYMRPGVEDVVFCYLRFPSGLAAHLHLSWLDPHKERRFTVVGSRKMATFDDMEVERKLTVYDKGFDEDFSSYGEYIARSGDVWSPRVPNDEPLRIECRALRGSRAGRPGAALGRRERAAGGARARGAAALPRRKPACSGRLTAPPACCWGRASSCRRPSRSAGNVVIHAGTRVGGEVRIQDGAVIGKPLALGPPRGPTPTAPAPATVGAGATICAGAVVLAGARIGAGAVVGDQAHVRERARRGRRLGGRPRLRGGQRRDDRRAREDPDGLLPDRLLDRRGRRVRRPRGHAHQRQHDGPPRPEHELRGATLRRACRVGGGAVLAPGRGGRRGGLRGGRRGGGGRRGAAGRGHGGARPGGARGGRTRTCWSAGGEAAPSAGRRACWRTGARWRWRPAGRRRHGRRSWPWSSVGSGAAGPPTLPGEADDPSARGGRGGGRDRRGGPHGLPRGLDARERDVQPAHLVRHRVRDRAHRSARCSGAAPTRRARFATCGWAGATSTTSCRGSCWRS